MDFNDYWQENKRFVTGVAMAVIVYLIDTLRRDRLGCYGYDRPVSPRIDAFAKRATRVRHGVAQSSWTKPSVASLFMLGCPW